MIADTFRTAAKNVINTFSIGNHVLKNVVSSTYDPETGETTTTYEEQTMSMAQDEINDARAPKNAAHSTHILFMFAGVDLKISPPLVGSFVITPSGGTFVVDSYVVDQYGALYELYTKR